jgi:hypothetical protein
MLERPSADTDRVIHRALVLAAFICSGLVLASFTLFARDQLAGASQHQQNEIVASQPSSPGSVPPSEKHGQPRRFIDGAAHELTSPFSSIVRSNNQWATHGLPTVFGLLVYGFGLGFMARYSRGTS